MSSVKTAALYWPTSSVGGINTELRALRDEAVRRGDVFNVLRSGLMVRAPPGLFAERSLIRGGDTFITIDGEASHHPSRVEDSIAYIVNNYDRVYLAYLCPHPTKDYGDDPHFLKLLQGIQEADVPIMGRVTDGYWETYAEWGAATIELCSFVTVSQPAFASFFNHPNVAASRFPFHPRKPESFTLYDIQMKPSRAKKPLTVWTSQWKAIKGIHKLLPYIPAINHDVELYSNGILYYQLRDTPDWRAAVGRDYFGETTPTGSFSGQGKAPFFGYIPLENIPTVLSRAWFMIDLMGIGRPRNKVYTHGSFNNTTVEALYYGACPVLHAQASQVVPKEVALFVGDAKDVPDLINTKAAQDWAVSPSRQRRAKQWVLENFAAEKVYNVAVLGQGTHNGRATSGV